jgi:solute carrier family 25 (mitochondrial dicarboxylate transporter), member 10
MVDFVQPYLQSGNTGFMRILKRSMRDEGPRFVFKGWTPAFVRLGPNTVLLFVFFEVCHSDLRKVTAPYFPSPKQLKKGCDAMALKPS